MVQTVQLFCGVCGRVKKNEGWVHDVSPRDSEADWKSTYCRYCTMEMSFAKNKELFEKLNCRLVDILKDLPTIGTHASVQRAAQLMKETGRGVVGAVSDGHLVGVLTDRDFSMKIVAEDLNPKHTLVTDVMSSPVIEISRHASIPEVALKMSLEKIRHLVVRESRDSWKVVSAQFVMGSIQTMLSQIYKIAEKELSRKKKY